MLFTETDLQGAFVIDLEKVDDERGYFARAWCAREFGEHGLSTRIAQGNLSFNKHKATLRGMHYQVEPYAEVKLVRCVRGALLDVIIDLRPDAPTYKQWIGVELSAANGRMLYVPEGFAHGFQTLEDDTEAFYLVSEFYTPDAERGVRWDDPEFGIKWPHTNGLTISDKDASWPTFKG